MFKVVGILFFSFVSSLTWASGPAFTNLSQSDYDNIAKEFSANFSHASVMGASALGSIFGFEVGLVGGQTPSPNTDKVVKAASSGDSLPNLYHGGLLLALTVPLGFTGEVIYTPKITSQGMDFQAVSAALKLTLNTNLLVIPFNMAIRAVYTNSDLTFSETNNGVTGTVENKNTETGLQLLFSPSLPLVEPYVGVGYLTAKNNLSSSISIFNTSVGNTQSQDSNPTTTQLLAGVTAHLLIMNLGFEYSHAFDANVYTGKISFGF